MSETPELGNREQLELDLSALLDGELSHAEVLDSIDRLLDSTAGQDFYRQNRRLGQAVQQMRGEEEEPAEPSEDLWRRISAASEGQFAGRRWRPTEWLPKLAAALLLAFGLWAVVGVGQTPQPLLDRSGAVELVLGEDRGQMTESRFVELATELLKADQRYHREMLSVMQAVAEEAPSMGDSDSADEPSRSSERRRISLGEDEGGESFRLDGWNL